MVTHHHLHRRGKKWRVNVVLPRYFSPVQGWIITLLPRPWLPALAFMMSGAILLGGASHFSSPNFAVLRTVAPWWGWAAAFAAVGALQLWPLKPRHEWKVRFIAAIPYLLFTVGLVPTVVTNPTAATTGLAVYTWVAAVHLRIASIRRLDARQRDDTL